jgi:tRNA 2-thiocytidine biosynthesis protein TtcA
MEIMMDESRQKLPKFALRFIKKVNRGISRFKMIQDKDRILLGISGGKDSLALAFALAAIQKWCPIKYKLTAVLIEWSEYPFNTLEKKSIRDFFKSLNIPLKITKATIFPPSFRGKFNCYLCSRNKKRILFEKAAESSIKKIALGHTMDDIIQTTLINLLFRGCISTMMPYQKFFSGKIHLIRPLCEVKERTIELLAGTLDFPVLSTACPNKNTNFREVVKPIIRDLQKVDRHVKEHIYRAPWHIQKKYLPSLIKD